MLTDGTKQKMTDLSMAILDAVDSADKSLTSNELAGAIIIGLAGALHALTENMKNEDHAKFSHEAGAFLTRELLGMFGHATGRWDC